MTVENTTTNELEVARDAKCEPIARAMFADIAAEMFSRETTHTDLVKKLLVRSLNEDLVISTEVSYIFQLMLSMLSGLNKTVQGLSQKEFGLDEERYEKIATRVLTMLSEEKVRMTNVRPEDTDADFAPLREKLIAYFKEENLSGLEIKYIMQECIFPDFTSVNNIYSGALEASSERAEAKLFGINSMSELTMSRLNEILLSEVPQKTPASVEEKPSSEAESVDAK